MLKGFHCQADRHTDWQGRAVSPAIIRQELLSSYSTEVAQ